MNYAIIENGIVINVIVWDGESDYNPGEGRALVPIGDSGAGIGWSYSNGEFAPPPAQ